MGEIRRIQTKDPFIIKRVLALRSKKDLSKVLNKKSISSTRAKLNSRSDKISPLLGRYRQAKQKLGFPAIRQAKQKLGFPAIKQAKQKLGFPAIRRKLGISKSKVSSI